MARYYWYSFFGLLGFLGIGGLLGLVVAGGIASSVAYTSTNDFCVRCHYAQWPEAEYQALGHFTNASGVRASCGDCHFDQQPWWRMLWQKTRSGTSHVIAHWQGSLATREAYEARRLALSERVWDHLEATDSGWCKNCHTTEAFDLEAQSEPARESHQRGLDAGLTCITCHKGVGHGIEP